MAQGLFNLKQVNQAIQQGGWSAQKPPQVEYLVIAGGGSGGGGAGYAGGGGGAGGFLAGMDVVPNGQSLLVTVGAGGVADAGAVNGTSGNNSVFGQIIAIGGGYGSYGQGSSAATGGSGGGNGCNGGRYGQATLGQGNIGGLGYGDTSGCGGGGGGAGAVGAPVGVYYNYAGNGGAGAASVITGTVTAYAGGGGGGGNVSNYGGYGGAGGGGNGARAGGSAVASTAGTANTGGGGGGGSNAYTTGSNGGSGIVAISYPDTYAAAASTTGSPTVSTSGSGSILCSNSSTQYLSGASNAAFALGTGNFTWEAWVNYTSSANLTAIYDSGAANSSGSFAVFASSGALIVRIDGTGNDLTYIYPGGFVGSWVHLAVVRSGTTLTLYYNGTSVATGTRSNNVTQNTPYIGNLNGFGSSGWNGYISNMRLIKGTAVYTGNFTPSTIPLTAVSGTSLLFSTVSGSQFIDSSSNSFLLTAVNSPTWNSSSPFATGLGYKNRVYTWTSSGSITF